MDKNFDNNDAYTNARLNLMEELRAKKEIDEKTLGVIARIPRHLFVPEKVLANAYDNTALWVDSGQTISQPYLVSMMTSVVCDGKRLKSVLEIGTGTGYQAAVLSQLVDKVYSIERIEHLATTAKERLKAMDIHNVHIKLADGNEGWLEHAPYEGIIVTAAPLTIPEVLLSQLADGAKMVIPVGEIGDQKLWCLTRQGETIEKTLLMPVRFVSLLSGIE